LGWPLLSLSRRTGSGSFSLADPVEKDTVPNVPVKLLYWVIVAPLSDKPELPPVSVPPLANGNLQMGATFNGGGSVVVTTNGSSGTYNGVDFSGAFSGTVAWTLDTLANGTHNYSLIGNIADTSGHSGALQLIINTGKGYFNGSTTISSASLTF
jgi:hypothetical protein